VVSDFMRAERWSRALLEVRMLSFVVRWFSVGRMGGCDAVRGRPRRDSRVVRRDAMVASCVVSSGE
jgi:hypothetical protein